MKSTSFYYDIKAKDLIIINTQSNYLFLVIGKIAERDNGDELINKDISSATRDKKPLARPKKDTAVKKLPTIEGENNINKRLSVIKNKKHR